MAAKSTENKPKQPAHKYDVAQLIVTAAYERQFSSGKRGFFGKAISPDGRRFQIIGAVELSQA